MDDLERANMTPEERMLDNEIEFQRAQSSAYCCSFCCVVREDFPIHHSTTNFCNNLTVRHPIARGPTPAPPS